MNMDKRQVISELYLKMTELMNVNQTGVDNVLIVLAVFIGTARGVPQNATNIAHTTGLPRSTVIRKLRGLVSRGAILHNGKTTFDFNGHPEVAGSKPVSLPKLEAAILKAAAKLSKVDD